MCVLCQITSHLKLERRLVVILATEYKDLIAIYRFVKENEIRSGVHYLCQKDLTS